MAGSYRQWDSSRVNRDGDYVLFPPYELYCLSSGKGDLLIIAEIFGGSKGRVKRKAKMGKSLTTCPMSHGLGLMLG